MGLEINENVEKREKTKRIIGCSKMAWMKLLCMLNSPSIYILKINLDEKYMNIKS